MNRRLPKIDAHSKLILSNIDIEANNFIKVSLRTSVVLNSIQLKLLDAYGLEIDLINGIVIVGMIRYFDITNLIKLPFINNVEVII